MKSKFLYPLLWLALLGTACTGNIDDGMTPDTPLPDTPNTDVGEGKLSVEVSRPVIRSNGQDAATITIYLDDRKVAFDDRELKFYTYPHNTPITLPSLYTTTQSGNFQFWVSYGPNNTYSTPTTISAVGFDVPTVPPDPDPANRDFVHRAFLVQHTGLGCRFCPYMIAALDDVLGSGEYSDKAILAACHTYGGDPYMPEEPIARAMGVSDWPTVVVDFGQSFSNQFKDNNIKLIRQYIDQSLATPAKAGISVGIAYDASQLVACVTVKAASEGSFRVGAWVLEDGLTGVQAGSNNVSGDYDFNTHDNVARRLDSRYSQHNYTGHDIGRIAAGETVTRYFIIDLDPQWNPANCHLAFFVTREESEGRYVVTNAIDVPMVTDSTPFAYIR